MKTKELLLECKIKLNISSDYALAKALEISTARICDYMNGKRSLDNYAVLKVAMVLERDPIELLAEIEAETEKNEKKKAFWVGFIQRAQQAAKITTLALIFTASLLAGVQQADRASGFRRRRICA